MRTTHIPSPERIYKTLSDGRVDEARQLNQRARTHGGTRVFQSRDYWLVGALVDLASNDIESALHSYDEACTLDGGPTAQDVARQRRHLFRYYLRKKRESDCRQILHALEAHGETSRSWLKLAEVELLLLSCTGKNRADRADICNHAERLVNEAEELDGKGASDLNIAWYRFLVCLHRPGGAKRSKPLVENLRRLRPDIGAKAHKLRRRRRFLP